MVLQNKYKARASRKYNAERGTSTSAGRGAARGRGRGRGRGSGRGGTSSPHPHIQSDHDDDNDQGDDDEDSDQQESYQDQQDQDPNFPSLSSTNKPKLNLLHTKEDFNPESSAKSGKKYSRRRLESNSWRYEEEQKDPHLEESDPEPEIDLTNLMSKISSLSTDDFTAFKPSLNAKERLDLENDVDRSLEYLNKKEKERRKNVKNSGIDRDLEEPSGKIVIGELERDGHGKLDEEEMERVRKEREIMRKDKEKAEALRALKERFQHRNIGDRESPGSKAKVLRIGPKSHSSSSQSEGPKGRLISSSTRGKGPLMEGDDDEDIDSFLDSLNSKQSLDVGEKDQLGSNGLERTTSESQGIGSRDESTSNAKRPESVSQETSHGDATITADVRHKNTDHLNQSMGPGGLDAKEKEKERKNQMLEKLTISSNLGIGDRSKAAEEGPKRKPKVENLEDFLDGMLG